MAIGIKVDEVLPRFLDDSEFYLKIMRDFLEKNEIQKVKEALADKEYEQALNYAFDIKGLSGSLGMTDTYNLAQQLCINLLDEDYEKALDDIYRIQEYYTKLQGLNWMR